MAWGAKAKKRPSKGGKKVKQPKKKAYLMSKFKAY